MAIRIRNICFNPRTPAGCDCKQVRTAYNGNSFNPRTPAGCDQKDYVFLDELIGFNPRTPAGCDVKAKEQWQQYMVFQSTHPCGVRLVVCTQEGSQLRVSIHAPLRGATSAFPAGWSFRPGFNPRTPAGCDCWLAQGASPCFGFNPRTPAGCDLSGPGSSTRSWVSIHAPLRGATAVPGDVKVGHRSFNPRTPAGCDVRRPEPDAPLRVSIHAPLRGAPRVA